MPAFQDCWTKSQISILHRAPTLPHCRPARVPEGGRGAILHGLMAVRFRLVLSCGRVGIRGTPTAYGDGRQACSQAVECVQKPDNSRPRATPHGPKARYCTAVDSHPPATSSRDPGFHPSGRNLLSGVGSLMK